MIKTVSNCSMGSISSQPNWHASLALVFTARANNKTVLSKNLHQGPLMVQKPFYPEDPKVCHIYLLHPPGGVVQGDQLQIDVTVEPHAHALITTPAAGKFYRSAGATASLTQILEVKDTALLEWLPQETLLFNASKTNLKTLVRLSGKARFIGWEMLCLGRKAGAEPYTEGQCQQHFELWRDHTPVFVERSQFNGQSPMLKETWGMNHWPLTATLIATNCGEQQLHAVRELLTQISIKGQMSTTLKQDVLICRFLGEQAEHARKYFIEVWKLIRPAIMQNKAVVPRIWNT